VITDTASGMGGTNYYDNICFDGSSLTKGLGLTHQTYENYAVQVMAALPTINVCDWHNNGLSGQTTAQMDLQSNIGDTNN